jgi:predicted ATPase
MVLDLHLYWKISVGQCELGAHEPEGKLALLARLSDRLWHIRILASSFEQMRARMLDSVEFKNFKVLRDTKLPLSRFTLIVGPNGSGKSTALQAVQALKRTGENLFHQFVTAGPQAMSSTTVVEVTLHWSIPYIEVITTARWLPDDMPPLSHYDVSKGAELSITDRRFFNRILAGIRFYSLTASSIAIPVQLQPEMELGQGGENLAGVLDRLRDQEPERFDALNAELGRWLPEFDRILFDTPGQGYRAFLLRTREGHHKIQAGDLSQGTLLALTILTLAYIPLPPPIVCLEEPDHGVHPRLLRDVRDALYRLSYPESIGETRAPVQVIATTHSPYFLDLFRDHPEEIVIAHRIGQEARFERLSDRSDLDEILGDAPLSEVWYSGILGGVPAER